MSVARYSAHLAQGIVAERNRLLPLDGIVLAEEGQQLLPDDVVAEADSPGGLRVVDVAAALRLWRDRAEDAIVVAPGQQIDEGTLLAETRFLGLLRREVRSPIAGRVRAVADGRLILQGESRPVRLRAHLPAEVTKVYPRRGVRIRCPASVVRGVCGWGAERGGVLVNLVTSSDQELTWNRVGLAYRGTILVGGTIQDRRTLLRAQQFRLAGLVVGSVAADLLPLCEQLTLPLVVTEGFGRTAMSLPIYDLLRSYHGRMAILAGSAVNGSPGPEVIVPLSDGRGEDPTMDHRELAVGDHVRAIRGERMGRMAEVLALPTEPQANEAGVIAPSALLGFSQGDSAYYPLVNVERLD